MNESESKRGKWKKSTADRGIYLRGKKYYIRFADTNGKLHTKAVGPSKAVARKVLAIRKAEVSERRFLPTSTVTFSELVEAVLSEKELAHKLAKRTKKFEPGPYRIVQRWFADRRADSITTEEIEKRLAEAKEPGTYNRKLYAINHAFRVAIKRKKITTNPCAPINAKRENNSRVRFLDADEEQRLRSAIHMLFPKRGAELDLALYTGLRWAEQYELRWKDVDLLRNQITLPQTKSGKTQHLPINGGARSALAKLRAMYPNSDRVCPGAGYYNDFKRKFWNPVITQAHIVDFKWHDLRHTFASRLVMKGADIFATSKLLRHGDVKTSMRYAHLSNEHLAAVAELLDEQSVTGSVQTPMHSTYLQ